MLVLPIMFSSIQIAIEAPGLPLGLATVAPGWKKKLLQTLIVLFAPITVLLFRLQYEMTSKKREKIQDLNNNRLYTQFRRMIFLLTKMENVLKKMIKIDLAFELSNEIIIGIRVLHFI